MNSLLLNNASEIWLSSAIIIVAALALIAIVSGITIRAILNVKYHTYNAINSKCKHTAFSAARNLLDENGMADIKVKRAGFFRTIFYGNRFSAKSNTIYLRPNIINSTSIIAVGTAIQKVGLVMQHKEGNKIFKFRAIFAPYILFTSYFVFPLLVLGLLFDVIFVLGGSFAIISVVMGILLYSIAILYTYINIPVESRANKLAIELIDKTKFLDDNEKVIIKQVYTTYILAYVTEFIVTLLEIIKVILAMFLLI